MNKKTIIWLVTAIALIVIGLILFIGAMSAYGWDFKKLDTSDYKTYIDHISEEFDSININISSADVVIGAVEKEEDCTVYYYQNENIIPTITVIDGTLTITESDNREWHEHIGISLKTPKLTLFLPQSKYRNLTVKTNTGDVAVPDDYTFDNIDISASTGDIENSASALESIKIKTSTGKILVEDVTAETLDVFVSTGKVAIKNTKCKSFTSKGDTGKISLDSVIVTKKITVIRDTGDVKLYSCDAAEIYIKTDTGDVTGSLLTEKVFITKTDTGSIKVPQTVKGGKCEINTDTGDIKISISPF